MQNSRELVRFQIWLNQEQFLLLEHLQLIQYFLS
jgi:hypothetical protein